VPASTAKKGIVRVEDVPVPEVADGEALIKVAACGICGTDIKKSTTPTSPRHKSSAMNSPAPSSPSAAASANGNWATA